MGGAAASRATRRLAILAVACCAVCLIGVGSSAASGMRRFPALIVFGDSIVDPGNNDYIKTIAKCNFPPYGRDFEGGVPTGRFSNGKVPSDILAEELGIKQLIPPYLDPTLQPEDLLTGVSFASGAAGYDPLSSQLASAISLTEQLNLFNQYKEKVTAAVGEERAATIVSDSLYLVASGSNDFTNTYYLTPFRRSHYDIDSYSDLVVGYASSFFQDLYNSGARSIGVLGAPPIGCLPSQRTLKGGPERVCVEEYNRAADIYNSKLKSAIQSLNTKLPGLALVYLDIYGPLLDLIMNPYKQGFEVANKGCCGTGEIEASILCTQYDPAGVCADASKYVFWDSYHPTQHTYEVLLRQIIKEELEIPHRVAKIDIRASALVFALKNTNKFVVLRLKLYFCAS